jgi:serine/threonine protein phosphatase 1
MRKFVVGDIHGGHKALKQVLERASFDYDNDQLICLGDVVDGWPETPQVIEELLKIKNLILIIGNHDIWCRNWFEFGPNPIIWSEQGGKSTVKAYIENPDLIIKHRDFFKIARRYYEDGGGRLFVHGGYNPEMPIHEQHEDFLTWDRRLWDERHNKIDISPYKEVYVGHTSIWKFSHKPISFNDVWFMDTGAGWEGCLSMMDIDTKEVYQSDKVEELYFSHKVV